MKCPKCGYVSFDYLDQCKKCGQNLIELRKRLGIIPVKPRDSYELPPSPPKETQPLEPREPIEIESFTTSEPPTKPSVETLEIDFGFAEEPTPDLTSKD